MSTIIRCMTNSRLSSVWSMYRPVSPSQPEPTFTSVVPVNHSQHLGPGNYFVFCDHFDHFHFMFLAFSFQINTFAVIHFAGIYSFMLQSSISLQTLFAKLAYQYFPFGINENQMGLSIPTQILVFTS